MLAGVIGNADFQSVYDLLAGSFNDRTHIAEGERLQQIVVSEHAFLNGVADRTAVFHGNIRIQHRPVNIGNKIAQIGFGAAHPAFAGFGIVNRQIDHGFANRLVQDCVKAFVFFGNQFGDFRIRCFQFLY